LTYQKYLISKYSKNFQHNTSRGVPLVSQTSNDYCSGTNGQPCCQIEAMVRTDERGQMVLPKHVRERAGIESGEALALVSWRREGAICCLCLIKAQKVGELTQHYLGPILGGESKTQGE